jgi:hypothetical protein
MRRVSTKAEELASGMAYFELPGDRYLGIGAPTGQSLLEALTGDERFGARARSYHGGDYCVYPNLYVMGRSLANRAASILRRTALRGGVGTFSWQARYGASSCASNGWCRADAIRQARRWIVAERTKSV